MGRYESKIGLEGNSGGIEPRFCITCGSTCKGSCSGSCKSGCVASCASDCYGSCKDGCYQSYAPGPSFP